MDDLKLPFAFDKAKNRPSVTLLFMYLSNVLALGSLVVLLIFGDRFVATTATCIYAVMQTVLYMFRSLQTAKFDLRNQSFEIQGNEHEKPDA